MAIERPAYTERVKGKLAPLKIVSFHETASDTEPLTQQLDALWHFECVVSPRSAAAKLPSTPSSPRSPRPSSPAAIILSPRLASPASPHSHAATSSPSPLSRFAPTDAAGQQVLQRVFSTFDENGDGNVSINEIARIFDRLGIPTSQYSLHSLLASLVTKSQGHVDEDEFLQLYDSVCSFVEEFNATASASSADADVDQDLLAAFHVFDKDGNGFISPSELQSVLCSLGFPQARQLDACVDMIARVDENGDGQVDFFEFKKLFHLENPFMSSIPSF